MKKWNRPTLFLLNNDQLNVHIFAVANSKCIRKHVR